MRQARKNLGRRSGERRILRPSRSRCDGSRPDCSDHVAPGLGGVRGASPSLADFCSLRRNHRSSPWLLGQAEDDLLLPLPAGNPSSPTAAREEAFLAHIDNHRGPARSARRHRSHDGCLGGPPEPRPGHGSGGFFRRHHHCWRPPDGAAHGASAYAPPDEAASDDAPDVVGERSLPGFSPVASLQARPRMTPQPGLFCMPRILGSPLHRRLQHRLLPTSSSNAVPQAVIAFPRPLPESGDVAAAATSGRAISSASDFPQRTKRESGAVDTLLRLTVGFATGSNGHGGSAKLKQASDSSQAGSIWVYSKKTI